MIEIEIPISKLFSVFSEFKQISSDTVYEVPGGATIRLAKNRAETRDSNHLYWAAVPQHYLPIAIEFAKAGKDIAIGVFAAWLYDKLKGRASEATTTIRVNRKTIEVTPEAIARICEESIEIDQKK
jgi:hypothetical protein